MLLWIRQLAVRDLYNPNRVARQAKIVGQGLCRIADETLRICPSA